MTKGTAPTSRSIPRHLERLWYALAVSVPCALIELKTISLPVNLLLLGAISILYLATTTQEKWPNHTHFLPLWVALTTVLMLSGIEDLLGQKTEVLAWSISVPIAAAARRIARRQRPMSVAQFVHAAATFAAGTSLLLQLVPALAPAILGRESLWVDEWGFQRFTGAVGDYELLGELLALGVIASAALIATGQFAKWQYFAFAAIASVLLFTGTRSALIVSLLALPVYLLTSGRFEQRRRSISGFAFASVLVLIALSMFGESVLRRIDSLNTRGNFSALINREQVWKIFESRTHGMSGILGIGPHYPYENIGVMPHSIWRSLDLLGGKVAVGIFALLIFRLVRGIYRSQLVKRQPIYQSVEFWILVAFLIDEYKIEFIRLPGYLSFIVICLALIALPPIESNEKRMATNA